MTTEKDQDLLDLQTTDSFRLYLDEVGRHPLLTKEDEIELSQAYEAGLAARAKLKDLGPDDKDRVEPAVGRVDRSALLGHWASPWRPGSGGQSGAVARGREVRLAQGLHVLDLRALVAPPGDRPWRRRPRCQGHPPAGPCGRAGRAAAPDPD